MQYVHLYADILIGSMGFLLCKITYESIHEKIELRSSIQQYNENNGMPLNFFIFLPYFWDFSRKPVETKIPEAPLGKRSDERGKENRNNETTFNLSL